MGLVPWGLPQVMHLSISLPVKNMCFIRPGWRHMPRVRAGDPNAYQSRGHPSYPLWGVPALTARCRRNRQVDPRGGLVAEHRSIFRKPHDTGDGVDRGMHIETAPTALLELDVYNNAIIQFVDQLQARP